MLADLDPKLVEVWLKLRERYQVENPGRDLILTCTHRSVAAQGKLYAIGRKFDAQGKLVSITPSKVVTYCDGVKKLSEHNYLPAKAFDFAVVVGGKVSWQVEEYKAVGNIVEELGVEWGGNWRSFKDYPHVQLRKT